MTIIGFIIWLDWIFYAYWPLLVLCFLVNILVIYRWLHIFEEPKDILPWTICIWIIYCYIEYGYGVG